MLYHQKSKVDNGVRALAYSKPLPFFHRNPLQKAPFTATESYPLCFVTQKKLL